MDKIICINLGLVVPKNKLTDVRFVFELHSAWMKKFYSESSNGGKYLISAYFTEATEFKDPTDPSKGETENVLFTLNEKFASVESLKRHNDHVKKNEYFSKFAEIKKEYAVFRSSNGKIYHSIR